MLRKSQQITIILIGIIILIYLINILGGSRSNRTPTSNANSQTGTPLQPTRPIEPQQPQSTPAPPFVPTDRARIEQAKNIMNRSPHRSGLEEAKWLLDEIPPSASEFKEAKALLATITTRLKTMEKIEAENLRENLKEAYREIITKENSHYNFIKSKITTMKGGYALWATHEFFSQYSFSAGNDARVVTAWINTNRDGLKKAGIVRVGLMGEGPYSSSCWFDVK